MGAPASPASSSSSSSPPWKQPFPCPCTLRTALMRYCDLRRAPSRRMLFALRPSLELEVQQKIDCLLADEAAMQIIQDEELEWTQYEFWKAIGAKHLDLAAFLWTCPRQRAWPLTIASSPSVTPGQVHACVSLVSHPAVPL